MHINKSGLIIAITVISGSFTFNVNAAMVTGTLLGMDAGYVGCPADTQCLVR